MPGLGLRLWLPRLARLTRCRPARGNRVNQYRRFFQIQAALLRLTPISVGLRVSHVVQRRTKGRFFALRSATDNPWWAQQFITSCCFFRQVVEVALQLEANARTPAHTTPTVEQNAGDDKKAKNEKPLTQTEIHEYPFLFLQFCVGPRPA